MNGVDIGRLRCENKPKYFGQKFKHRNMSLYDKTIPKLSLILFEEPVLSGNNADASMLLCTMFMDHYVLTLK